MIRPTIFLKVNNESHPYETRKTEIKKLVTSYLGYERLTRWRYEDFWNVQFVVVWEKLSSKAVLMLLQNPDVFSSEPQFYDELLRNMF